MTFRSGRGPSSPLPPPDLPRSSHAPSAHVAEDDASGYRVQFLSGEDSIELEGRLGRLAGRLVMELKPAPRDHEVRELYRSLLVPGHLIMALEPRGDSLCRAQLELDRRRAAGRPARPERAHRLAAAAAAGGGAGPRAGAVHRGRRLA
jgi:hypothetical protein